MATLTELLVGADTDGYEPFCDDLYNNLKNHWRRAAVRTTLTEAQAGMIGVDSANDTMWHCVAPGAPPTWRQIVQTTVPVLDDLNIFFGTNSDGSVKYDEATNDALVIGVPVTAKRGVIWCRTADIGVNFTALLAAVTQPTHYLVDADQDSYLAWGFTGDDLPAIWSNRVLNFPSDVRPLDDILMIFGSDSDASQEYDELTNDAWVFGIPASKKVIWTSRADVAANKNWPAPADNQMRWYDDDEDNYIDFGFYADDIGLLTVPANPLRENMLTNSGFGVWSNSDANKGLATLVFDNKAGGNFAVGNTITGATSGATGKLITTDNATTMTLGAVSGTFQDNEQISNGAGVTADVNGDTAIGIKNDPMNNDSTGLWTDDGANITLAFVAAEYSVTTDAATQRAWITAAALTAGKIYKIELDIKDGTAAGQQIEGYFNDGAAQYGAIKTTTAGWVSVSWTFECATTTAAGLVGFRIPVSLGALNIQIRRFSCYEITPCCTAADVLGFDEWIKETTSDIYRQHNDGGTLTKQGSFYSLKFVPCAVNAYVLWPGYKRQKEDHISMYKGRTVTFGAWIKTSAANHARLNLQDDVSGWTSSSYHTGGGGWEWIEITKTFNSGAITDLWVSIRCYAAPNVNGSTIVYISQPMLVFGSSIGAGNFRPRQQEIIYLENPVPISTYHNKTGLSDVAVADLNLESETEGKLSKGAKTVLIQGDVNDSGSAGTDCYLQFRASATEGYGLVISPAGLANDMRARGGNWQKCDSNGDVDINLEATGVGTFDITTLKIHAIQVN